MNTGYLKQQVFDETVWYAKDLQANTNWMYVLSTAQQDEFLRALDLAKYKGATPETIGKADFPLPEFGTELDEISVRGYKTSAQLTPHCDTGDLLSLLCVRPAKEGGINNISCSMAIHNELLMGWPELLEPLYRGFYYNIRGNGPEGKYKDVTAHRVPVFSAHNGILSCRYNQKAILTAQELPNSEALSEIEQQAINKVAELAMRDDIRFDIHLKAGDLAFLNNHTVLHNRSQYIDYDEESRRRLLLRQWINQYEVRELTCDFADYYNTGPRKGPAIHGRTIEHVSQ